MWYPSEVQNHWNSDQWRGERGERVRGVRGWEGERVRGVRGRRPGARTVQYSHDIQAWSHWTHAVWLEQCTDYRLYTYNQDICIITHLLIQWSYSVTTLQNCDSDTGVTELCMEQKDLAWLQWYNVQSSIVVMINYWRVWFNAEKIWWSYGQQSMIKWPSTKCDSNSYSNIYS